MPERNEELNNIQTWRQGAFIDGPRYKHWTDDEKETARQQESWLVRPSAMGNAICVVRERPEDAAWIAERLNKCAELEADPLKPLRDLGYTPTPTGLVAPIGEIECFVLGNTKDRHGAWRPCGFTFKVGAFRRFTTDGCSNQSRMKFVKRVSKDYRQWLIMAKGGEVE